jgi:serine/threonine protein kinase
MSTEGDFYQLARSLRANELSETYEATHPARPGRFLVEVLAPSPDPPGELPSPGARLEGFERELVSLADAHNPNILEVIGLGQLPDGRTVAIWELPGATLAERLGRREPSQSSGSPGGPPPSAEVALGLIAGIANALQAAHERGVVHERMSLDDVFVLEQTEGGFLGVKLGGFGLRWFSPTGPRADAGPPLEIGADLAGLAEIAERLLEPLDLLSTPPAPSSEEAPPPATLIARARGESAGRPFESVVQFSETLARAVRVRLAEASGSTLAPFAAVPEPGVASSSRLGRVVARVGVATLVTVAAVLIVGSLASRSSSSKSPQIRKPSPEEVAPTAARPLPARAVSPVGTAPAAMPPLAAPPPVAAAPPARQETAVTTEPTAARTMLPGQDPDKQAAQDKQDDSQVSVRPPERPRAQPPRIRRGLVWSDRLQRLVKVEDLSAVSEPPPPP